MSQDVVTQVNLTTIEQVLIGGDLAKLNASDRVSYYKRVCETLGLNPLTKPFDYITLNNRLVLYATKGCAEQLRAIHKVSVVITSRETIEGVYVVTAQAKLPDGREDGATGAVTIQGLKGESLANAFMKAETKAKRRASLSICGLNMLDETEVDGINPGRIPSQAPDAGDGNTTVSPLKIEYGGNAGKNLTEIPRAELMAELEERTSRPAKNQSESRHIGKLQEHLTMRDDIPSVDFEAESDPSAELSCSACSATLLPSKYSTTGRYCPNYKDKSKGEHTSIK